MKNKIISFLAVITLVLGLSSVSVAQADPLRPDYGHWGQDCPYGLTVRLGGGEGWRHYMRRAIDGWNFYVAPHYWAAPRITNIVYVPWDGKTQYYRCTIDFDEPYDIPNFRGWGNAIPFPDNHHYAGGAVQIDTQAWHAYSGAGSFAHILRDRLTAHELQHAMGLGHNPECNSVMNVSGCPISLAHNHRDRHTLSVIYSHKH